jgi:thiol-disulfide isomerase/thioredoxin
MDGKREGTGSRIGGHPAAEATRAARRRRLLMYGVPSGIVVIVAAIAIGTSPFGRSEGRPAAAGTVQAGPGRATPLQSGEAVPDFSAPGLSGARVSWSEVRAGAPAALVVWASWCPHCQRELPVVAKVAPEFPGVRVVTVATAIGAHPGPSPEAFVEGHGITFPAAVDDAGGAIAGALGVQSFPTVFWVGKDGRVRAVTEGERGEAAVRAAFQALTAG